MQLSALGPRIRDLLHDRRLTQRELARRSGIHEAAISHFVRGARVPTLRNLVRIADTLNVTLDELTTNQPDLEP